MTFRFCKVKVKLADIYPGSLGLTIWIQPEYEKQIVAEVTAAIKMVKR